MTVTSPNPAPVEEGEASFTVELAPGYRFSNDAGALISPVKTSEESGAQKFRLTFRTISGDSYFPVLSHPVTLKLAENEGGILHFAEEDEEGVHEKREAEKTVYTDETVVLTGQAIDEKHYSFSGVSQGERFYPADEEGVVRGVFEEGGELSAVLLGVEVAARVGRTRGGSVTEDGEEGYGNDPVRYGQTLHLRARPIEGEATFSGWSRGGSLEEGGELVSKSPSYDFVLGDNSEIFANFTPIDEYTVTIAGRSTPLGSYGAGNTVELPLDDGSFSSPGKSVLGFLESGGARGASAPQVRGADDLAALLARDDFHAFGALFAMPEHDLTLLPVALPESDSAYFTFEGGRLTGLTGSARADRPDLLVIPSRTPDDTVLSEISRAALRDLPSLRALVLPPSVRTVGERALALCSQLETLVLPDTLTALDATALDACPKLSRVLLHETLSKVFDIDFDCALADKYVHLLSSEKYKKRLIVVGGSGCAYGFCSGIIERAYPGYRVVNLGTAANYGLRPLLLILERRARAGDVVLLSPEYRADMYGSPAEAMTLWQAVEVNPDILRDIDLTRCREILSSFTDFLESKRSFLSKGTKKVNNIVYSRASFDEHGDLIAHRPSHISDFESALPDPSILTDEGLAFLADSLAALRQKGAACLFTYPLLSRPPGAGDHAIAAAEEEFSAALLGGVDEQNLTVISTLADSILDADYFYDTRYHATLAGAREHTRRLVEDLRQYLP